MGEERLSVTGQMVTPEERANVAKRLKANNESWSGPPDYATKDRGLMLKRLEHIYDAIKLEVPSVDKNGLEAAYEKSQYFVDSTYDLYLGKKALDSTISRAFIVPMFSSRHDEEHVKESLPFLPMLDPDRFGVNSDIRMRTIYNLPPTVLDTNLKSGNEQERGALVLTPLFRDMAADIMQDNSYRNPLEHLTDVRDHVLELTANFAHKRLGAKILGLGATLPHPAITDFGKVFKNFDGMENLVTTTGHGGTVAMIVETVHEAMKRKSIDSQGKLGVIGGAGSIGWASTVAARKLIEDHHIYTFDNDEGRLMRKINGYDGDRDKIHPAASTLEILQNTNIIISAVTEPINLDAIDPEKQLDLSGKVIIDDSQPACFDPKQVEARNGKLVWIVGEDGSASEFMTRDGLYTNGRPYDYGGDKSGLYGAKSEFACSLETAALARIAAYHDAISGPVTPDNVIKIGNHMKKAGVRVAPLQAYGQPVHID